MEFYSARELRTNTKSIWNDLSRDDDVVITNNGKPYALMVGIPEGRFDETVRAIRQARAIAAMDRMRSNAKKTGFLSDEEIDEAVREAVQDASVVIIDPSNQVCPNQKCSLLNYKDDDHLRASYLRDHATWIDPVFQH